MTNSLFDKIASKENLYRAAFCASRGKRYNKATASFNYFMEKFIDRLHENLKLRRYRHGPYRHFRIFEPKEREISKAPFRDRVIHHAFHDVIEPRVDQKFIFDSYACRKGKGTHVAVDRAQKFLRANKFCFHGDVRKYFPSIDHDVMKRLLRRYVQDEDILKVLDGIVDSSGSKGLPIGNLTSQFFANMYLHELDFFVKHTLRCRYYIRYMDDFLVFGTSREELIEVKLKIRDFLRNELKLEMHEAKSQIYRNSSGIKFLGFRIFRDRRRLATENVRRFRKRLRELDLADPSAHLSIRTWFSHAAGEGLKGLRLSVLRSLHPRAKNGCILNLLLLTTIFLTAFVSRVEAVYFTGGDGRGEAIGSTASWASMFLNSVASQSFLLTDGPTSMSALTITQEVAPVGAGVLVSNGIRVIIPSSVAMVWNGDTATIAGSAYTKVGTGVTYENNNKTLVLSVLSNFADGDSVTVSGLSFKSFTSTTVTGQSLQLDIDGDGTIYAQDTFTKSISAPERSSGFTGGNGKGESLTGISGWRDRSMFGME